MFDFSIVTNWIHELLLSIMPEGLAVLVRIVLVNGVLSKWSATCSKC